MVGVKQWVAPRRVLIHEIAITRTKQEKLESPILTPQIQISGARVERKGVRSQTLIEEQVLIADEM